MLTRIRSITWPAKGVRFVVRAFSRWTSTYRGIFVLYFVLFASLTFPFWFRGEINAPNRLFAVIRATEVSPPAGYRQSYRIGDYHNFYIPEARQILKGPRSGWLALWSEQNEGGRPFYHLSGISPAYFPSWLLSKATTDPLVFLTALSLSSCFASGLFLILLAREWEFHPLAALIGGLGLATGPWSLYWLPVSTYLFAWCWCAGAAWAVTRLSKGVDFYGWLGLAFSIYSLLMTAYAQLIVLNSYILGGYGLVLTYRSIKKGTRPALRFVVSAATAVTVGAVLAVPVYSDLWNAYLDSARVVPDMSFYLGPYPDTSSWRNIGHWFLASTMPELLDRWIHLSP